MKSNLGYSGITGQILSTLLRCMPLLKVLKLAGLEIEELDSDKYVVLKSLTQFDMTSCTIKAKTLLAMLSGLPSLHELKLYGLNIKSDSDILVVLKSLTQFTINRPRIKSVQIHLLQC